MVIFSGITTSQCGSIAFTLYRMCTSIVIFTNLFRTGQELEFILKLMLVNLHEQAVQNESPKIALYSTFLFG